MKPLIAFLLSLILALPAFATVDPDPDQIGVYFDTDADLTCIDVPPSTPFWAYLIVTRPTSPEVHGIEFSLCEEVEDGYQGMLFRLSAVWTNGGINPPFPIDWCNEAVAHGFAGPVLPVQGNAVLVSMQYMLLAPVSLDFYLGPYPVQSIEDGLPAYLGADHEIISLGVSSGDPDLPVASVNGCNAIPVESRSLGDIKANFR
jgi:hypothetical protein